jgi:formylglycine-generating enzyme required for sulfatase activity
LQRLLCILVCLGASTATSTTTSAADSYAEIVPGTDVKIEMVAVPGGRFRMGSPTKEKGRRPDEGPVREIEVRPFWISRTEIPWDAYSAFLDIGVARVLEGSDLKKEAPDAITYPTPPYADETFGYGGGAQPTIAVTVHAAMEFARWLGSKSGHVYRLPTEAEWEYACRAGTATPWSFGAAARVAGEFAWFASNSKRRPHPVGLKKPNPFGLHDMHGNVAEWALDHYAADFYARPVAADGSSLNLPTEHRYPHVVRGGGWKDAPPALRCAARRASKPEWSKQDPQNPQSVWWHTEPTDVGFRLVRASEEHPALQKFRSQIKTTSP